MQSGCIWVRWNWGLLGDLGFCTKDKRLFNKLRQHWEFEFYIQHKCSMFRVKFSQMRSISSPDLHFSEQCWLPLVAIVWSITVMLRQTGLTVSVCWELSESCAPLRSSEQSASNLIAIFPPSAPPSLTRPSNWLPVEPRASKLSSTLDSCLYNISTTDNAQKWILWAQ